MEDLSASPAAPVSRPGGAWPFPRRFIALFTSPTALFEHLAERPSWLLPFLVMLALFVLFYVILWNPVILPEMLARFEETDAGDAAVDMMTKNGFAISMTTGLIFAAGFTFLTALVVQLIGGFLLGGTLNYRQALSLVTHAGLIGVPAMLVMVPLAFVAQTVQVSVGPGMLFPPKDAVGFAAKFFANLLTSLDVFRLWQTALVAIGVSVIGRVPRGKAAVGIWSAYAVAAILGGLVGAISQR